MSSSVTLPRVRTALDRIAEDQRRLAREHLELAARREDGPGRGNGSWLAAKFHEDFAEYISRYDPEDVPLGITSYSQLFLDTIHEKKASNWRKWKRFLR